MTHISHKEFATLNCLPVIERFNQCIDSIVLEYVNGQYLNYLNDVFQAAPENNIQTKGSFQKLKCPFRKTNCLALVQPYRAKTLRRLSEQKISTRLNII